jgi:membrane-bound serine protease (ClpP class)
MLNILMFCSFIANAQNKKIFLMEIKQEIDPRMSRYVRIGLESAKNQNADIVLIEMNTYGGALNDADSIRTKLLEFDRPVWVFINKNAASAGALISIACDSIYMAEGANIGAATVVSGGDGRKVEEKYQSYMRSMMRSTAEANKRNPIIAERMVEGSNYTDSISVEGKVITYTTSEAIKNGFCNAQVSSIDEILTKNKLQNAQIVRYELSTSERIISIFLNPYISSLLIMLIIGGIIFEMKAPGATFPILIAIVAAVMYFIPYYLSGLAENWEIVTFIVGLILIAIEVFVLPGFGIAGVAGIVLTIGSLALVMLNNNFFDFTYVNDTQIMEVLIVVFSSLLCGLVMILFAANRLGKEGGLKGVALDHTLDNKDGYSSQFLKENLMGKEGKSETVLRPSGKIKIGDDVYDATTLGGYIEQGKYIVVIAQEGDIIKVKEKV